MTTSNMPSYAEIRSLEVNEVYDKVVSLKPEVVHSLMSDLYTVLHTGSYPVDEFYTVKTTLTMLRGILSSSELYGDAEN